LRSSYIFNSKIVGIEEADYLILIGTNPRFEAPVLNARIRKAWINNDVKIGYVGPKLELNYPYEWLGDSPKVVDDLVNGKGDFRKQLGEAKRPVIILGSTALQRSDGGVLLAKVQKLCADLRKGGKIASDWRVLNVMHRIASQVGALDLGYSPGAQKIRDAKPKILFNLGADEGVISRNDLHKDCFIIYQGHHGDKGAEIADAVLPGSAYTEKEATYVNMEGRAQRTVVAVTAPGLARDDWKIIRALSELAGVTLPYDNLTQLRSRMTEISPTLTKYNYVEDANYFSQAASLSEAAGGQSLGSEALDVPLKELQDFYMTDVISRASPTMAKCVTAVKKQKQSAY